MFEGIVKADIYITKIPLWVPSLLKKKKTPCRIIHNNKRGKTKYIDIQISFKL